MAAIANAKLKKSAGPQPSAPAPAPPGGGLMAAIAGAGQKVLKKVVREEKAPEAAGDPMMEELRKRAAGRKNSMAALEQLGQPKSKGSDDEYKSDLVKEIEAASLRQNDSIHKVPTLPRAQEPAVPTPAVPTPAAPPVSFNAPKRAMAPKSAAKTPATPTAVPPSGTGERQIAPKIDHLGKPIPEWKRKIKQKKLDAAYEAEQSSAAEHLAKEARWVGVPAWKRAMLEKKEAEERGEVAPTPAKPVPPASGGGGGELGLKKLKKTGISTTAPPPAPVAAPPAPKSSWKPPAAAAAPPQPKFDPFTGLPLGAGSAPTAPAAQKPPPSNTPSSSAPKSAMPWLQKGTAANAPGPAQLASATGTQPPDEDGAPLLAWKKALVEKKKAQEQARLDELRQEKMVKEARWIGVPAWKRKIIEEKERAGR